MAPRHLAVWLLTLALASCGSPPVASRLAGSASPAASARASAVPPTPGASVPMPGRPYDGPAVLQAMRESRRPGGVPDQLENAEIAAAVASELWTWDGDSWPELVIGGSCGPASCSLEIAGSPPAAAGSDLYVLQVEAESAAVRVESADLHGYPVALDRELEALCQAKARKAVAGLTFASARWLPPPDSGQFWVAYRSGGEEGSAGVDLLIDLAGGEVLDRRPT